MSAKVEFTCQQLVDTIKVLANANQCDMDVTKDIIFYAKKLEELLWLGVERIEV